MSCHLQAGVETLCTCFYHSWKSAKHVLPLWSAVSSPTANYRELASAPRSVSIELLYSTGAVSLLELGSFCCQFIVSCCLVQQQAGFCTVVM